MNDKCPCGDIILADTEEWLIQRCLYHATKDGLTDHWRCNKCGYRPYACLCNVPEWIQGIVA